MRGIPSVSSTGSQATAAARPDRTTLVASKALQEKKREAVAMIRLIEITGSDDKGQVVDYLA